VGLRSGSGASRDYPCQRGSQEQPRSRRRWWSPNGRWFWTTVGNILRAESHGCGNNCSGFLRSDCSWPKEHWSAVSCSARSAGPARPTRMVRRAAKPASVALCREWMSRLRREIAVPAPSGLFRPPRSSSRSPPTLRTSSTSPDSRSPSTTQNPARVPAAAKRSGAERSAFRFHVTEDRWSRT
jgi:hypothetical protein